MAHKVTEIQSKLVAAIQRHSIEDVLVALEFTTALVMYDLSRVTRRRALEGFVYDVKEELKRLDRIEHPHSEVFSSIN